MAIRFYVIPKIGTGVSTDPFRPNYVEGMGISWRAIDHAHEDAMLVVADVTPTQHTTLVSNADVLAVPQDLDSTLTAGAVTIVQSRFEAVHIPAEWVTTNTTYRQVLRVFIRVCLLLQRFDGLFHATFWEVGLTLDTTVGQLSATQKQRIRNAAESQGLDTSFITNAMTLRFVFRTWANAMPPLQLGDQVF